MGTAMRDHDWDSSYLGRPENWPQPLKTLVGILLAADQPMFVAWGAEHVLLYNDGYAPMLADRHPGALGRPFFEVWPEVEAELTPLFDRVAGGEPIHMADISLELDRAGRAREAHFAFSYTPIRDEAGQVAGLFCACTETTDRVLADRQSLAARNRLFEMTRDLFGVATFDGYLKTINPAWSSVLGRPHADLIARPFSEIIHPDDLGETSDVVAVLLRGEPVHQFRVRLLKADGTPVSFAWSAIPDADPESGIFYTVGRDITEELRREEMLRQSQKMEAVGQLTGGLAHDFNNLLTGMMGNLELLQVRLAQGRSKDVGRYVDAAQGAAKRAATLTHRLLAFSRRQTLEPKPVNLNRLVAGMEELIRRTVGPEIAVEPMVGAAGLWTTFADPGQLENALLNLCINARDAMPNGGKITIETGNRWLDDRGARDRSLPPGQYVSLCVSDTGTGMAPETIAKAFDPFFTTKPIGVGTGLGLSMIYGFAQQSGGQVRIYSEVGHGAMVCIYLPRHLGVEEGQGSASEVVEIPRAEVGQTVLVVDDEPTVRGLVTEILEDLGYTALEAHDGASGLKVLHSDVRIDLLVTDVGLPGGLNGRQVADAARASRPDLKVLFITGYAENAVLSHGHLDPGMHVLTKPFAMEALAGRIKDLIGD
ncbi:PAS domain-containing sensor histidine kinase [Beijerinckia sp. L45]|uniref:hybrid sensor histidine kinase/response regulator n=1 Tax=Beijerinckia sp. L45 TaxID=1641855 RepID=UPI00131B0976|nr:PAS domain-containing sensor histidine kinase [Beijerinckia sp. L45]